MTYALFGFVALIIVLIINYDVLFDRSPRQRAAKAYRAYLMIILGYLTVDSLWGVLDNLNLTGILYIETVIYHIFVALSIVFWCRYVVAYLNPPKYAGRMLVGFGVTYFVLESICLIINLRSPIFFWFDDQGIYHTGIVRDIVLFTQVILYTLVAALSFIHHKKTGDTLKRHHLTIATFCIGMTSGIIIQLWYPYLPLYTTGLMIGLCSLHVFVHEDEKQYARQKLAQSEKSRDENIAANKAKTAFLENMNHEIRTPLSALYGFAQVLGLPDGSLSESEKELYLQYIHNSYNMLDLLISDIIDMADEEHGHYRIHIAEVAVNQICRDSLISVEYRKPDGVNMYFTSDLPDTHTINSDGRRIQQVLVNYLTNACKHTMEGEIHLHCSTSENPGMITFSVTDTGSGIPADKADIIFKRFTKLDQVTQGSGLGLNICQMVADKLNGRVYLDKTYTTGARFAFTIEDK